MVLILCSLEIFSQDKGIGLNIQIYCESDISDDGTSKTEIRDNAMKFGGSFHYFPDDSREYEGDLFIGFSSTSNGVSEIKQTFFGWGGGVNLPIVRKDIIASGIGGRVRFEGYLKPQRTPALDYDHYFEGLIALEIPLFLDVSLKEDFLFRLSAVAAGFLYDIRYQEAEGIKETVSNLDFYTTTTSDRSGRNWFPVSIYFIYKL